MYCPRDDYGQGQRTVLNLQTVRIQQVPEIACEVIKNGEPKETKVWNGESERSILELEANINSAGFVAASEEAMGSFVFATAVEVMD